MKALIDIKTPAGQSLEGFPQTLEEDCESTINSVICMVYYDMDSQNHKLSPGDTITITIKE